MKKKIVFIVKFSLAFTVSLVVLEIFLRLTQISLPSTITIDKKLGRKFKPNARIMIAAEGFRMGKTNKYGYTGTAYPPERNRDALRIALVGDSYVEGHYLPERYYFGKIMEKELPHLINRDVEVLNFGLAGLNFRRMYINYAEWVTDYNPDITLFFIAPFDLLEKETHLGPRCRMENGSLVISHDFNRSRSYKIREKLEFLRNFSFFSLLQKAYAMFRLGRTGHILLGSLNPFGDGDGDGEGNGDAGDPPSMQNDDYLEINRAIFKKLRAVNDTGKSRNIIVLKSAVPAYYKKMIEGMGLPLIDLSGELEKMESEGIDPYYWKATKKRGHWNHEAQRMIGNYLAEQLSNGELNEKSSH